MFNIRKAFLSFVIPLQLTTICGFTDELTEIQQALPETMENSTEAVLETYSNVTIEASLENFHASTHASTTEAQTPMEVSASTPTTIQAQPSPEKTPEQPPIRHDVVLEAIEAIEHASSPATASISTPVAETPQTNTPTTAAPSSFTTTQAANSNVIPHFVSTKVINASPQLAVLNNFDPGFHKTVLELIDFPKDMPIYMESKRMADKNGKNIKQEMTFTIQPDGTLLTADKRRLNRIVISSKGFIPGEKALYRFRTDDDKLYQVVSIIPNPATFKNKEGNTLLEAELVSIEPTVYKITIPTMPEGEVYDLKTTSIGETITAKPTYSKAHPFFFSPAAEKKPGGDSTLEIQRKSGDIYFVKLPWGTALKDYLEGKRQYPAR